MSVVGLNSMVKYSPSPLGAPSGFALIGTPSDEGLYLTIYPLSRPYMDTVQCSSMHCIALWNPFFSTGELFITLHYIAIIQKSAVP